MSGTAQSGTFFGAPQGSMPVESHLTCLARTFTAYERRTYSALVAKFVQNGKLREPRWLGLSLIGSTGLVEIKKHR